MWKQRYKCRSKGFTLIELIVTVGIIGILAGIGVVTVGKIRATSQQTTCISNLRSISQGMQLYYNDYMSFPEDGYPDGADDLYPLSTDLAGYKFEVVTPSAIVGVRGTEFTVQTSANGSEAGYRTDVSLTFGIVVVTDRETGKATTLKIGGTESTTTGDVPLHSHYHTHVNGERHMHDHPSQNQAHHGKPNAGEDDESSSPDPDDITICHKPGTGAERTMVIPQSAWPGHQGHGDSLGACP